MKMFRKHPDIIPLVALVTTVVSGVIVFGIRAAIKYPDVSWAKKSNPEPWNTVKQNQRTHLLATPNHDYENAKFPEERPSMDNEIYKGI